MQTAEHVLEIVAYEACRLFRDKIVGRKDLHVFDNILMKVFQSDWGSDFLDNMEGKAFEAYYINLKYLNRNCLITSNLSSQIVH